MFNVLAACTDYMPGLPAILPNTVSMIVNLIKIAIPIILIVFGMIDLGKAVMAGKEDEIKKSQMTFVKRLIAAIIVFFVVAIVQLVFGMLSKAADGKENPTACIDCFINGNHCGDLK